MSNHTDHVFNVNHLVGGGDGLLRLTGIIAFDQYNFLAIHSAARIDICCCLRGAAPDLVAKCSVGPGERGTHTDFDIGNGMR